jgi:hypothetical protein
VSFAFAAVILFLLFAPGIVFRRAYLSYPLSRRYAASSASDEVAYAAVPAVVLQFLMVELIQHWSSYRVDFASLGVLLIGAHGEEAQAKAFRQLGDQLAPIASFNFALWGVAAVSGYCARVLVFAVGLDTRWQVFRFNNDWYYLLTGRQWRLREGRDFDVIWIDALVKSSPTPVLYSGILDYYFLSRDGGMDSVCLSHARRWVEPHPRRPVPIPGQSVVLKYLELLNLNISFYRLNELPRPGAAQPRRPKEDNPTRMDDTGV